MICDLSSHGRSVVFNWAQEHANAYASGKDYKDWARKKRFVIVRDLQGIPGIANYLP